MQLRERLVKFKSVKEEKKEMLRKDTAKSLKFMRKLGRKLRHPVFRKINGIPTSQVSAHGIGSFSLSVSPPKFLSPNRPTGVSSPAKSFTTCDY